MPEKMNQMTGKPTRREFLVSVATTIVIPSLGLSSETRLPLIVLFASGGMSAKESFTPDPMESSENLRGPFRAIQTKTGERFCELFPMLAERSDKFTLVRSLDAESLDHIDAARNALTKQNQNLQEQIGSANGGLQHAFLNPNSNWPAVHSVFRQSNALTPAYRNGRFVPPDLTPHPRLSERRKLLQILDVSHSGSETSFRAQRFRELAFELLQGEGTLSEAFQLPENERGRYGRNLAGDGMLLAKRLVKAGAGAVTLYYESDNVAFDFHSDLENGMRNLAPQLDKSSAAIIDDISKGELNAVFLLFTEFSRTPDMRGTGRDHHRYGGTAILAGGSSQKGLTYGRVNARGQILDGRVPHSEFGNTVLAATGADLPPNLPRIR